jgi:hypothetical protein
MQSSIIITVDDEAEAELTQAGSIEVVERMGEMTTYRLSYPIDISEGDILELVDGRYDPGSELSIRVSVDDENHCLVKGPVHGQDIHLKHGGAGSSFTVHGSDSAIKMDRETRSVQWSDVTDDAAVSSICANYGLLADIQGTNAGHFENKHTLIQRDSDLRFVKRLARRNGYLFWITCDAAGIETAHFKPPPLAGSAANSLIINMDSPNLDTFDISWGVERISSVIGAQLDLNTKNDLDGNMAATSLTILGDKSLQQITGDTRSIHLDAPVDDAGDLQARGEGTLTEANWFIRAHCETSIYGLGGLVRAHTLVEVRGAGSRHSGTYFVAAVRHLIDSTAHRMEITLLRNGWSG